jgi:hypothetical protein
MVVVKENDGTRNKDIFFHVIVNTGTIIAAFVSAWPHVYFLKILNTFL